MKHTFFFLACIGLMLSLTACGDDEPEIPRDRDVTMTVDNALTHVLDAQGNASLITGNSNTFVFHPKTLTADMQLNVTLDGAKQTFSLTAVPVTAVDYTYRYNFNTPTTSNADVTNLIGTIDISDPIAILQCDIKGHHVCITITDVFFNSNSVLFTYSDNSNSLSGNSYWSFKVDNSGQKANILINDLYISNDILIDANGSQTRSGRYFSSIIGKGATVTPTTNGISITASELSTTASYGNSEHTPSAYKTDNYPIRDLNAEINFKTGTYSATMVIRHVLARNEDKSPSQWEDINVTASGHIFKQPLFN